MSEQIQVGKQPCLPPVELQGGEGTQHTWAGLLTLNQQCRIAQANPAASEIANTQETLLLGKRFCEAYLAEACPDPGRATCQFVRALRGTERRTAPRWATLSPEGVATDVLLGATSVPSETARADVHRVVVTMIPSQFVDSADRRRREMIAGAVHEIRHAVTVQTLAADLLGYRSQSSPETALIIDKLQHATALLNVSVEDLFSRTLYDVDALPVEPREMLLAPLVNQIVWQLEPLLQKRGQHTRLEVPGSLQLYADPKAVGHMLVNLLSNAHKYSVTGDQFVIAARYTEDGNAVRLVVRDHGPGVPLADRRRIFTRFFRGASADGQVGAGLGLAIVSSLVSRHGGRIGVRTAPGGGAIFWIELPRWGREGTNT